MSRIRNKKEFTLGLVLQAAFWISFAIMMSPVFGEGRNILNVTDDLFNSVSMASVAKYIPEARETAETVVGEEVSFTTEGKDEGQTERIRQLLEQNGAAVTGEQELQVQTDLGILLEGAADDSQTMFDGEGAALASRYGYDERHVMNDWWTALDEGARDLTRQGEFEASNVVNELLEKAVEPSYNYFGITPKSASSEAPLIILSLAGYILYTVWYGYSLLFMFEGWGLRLEH
ncbi:MAG: hypothetical protein IBX61_04710 [Thermoleophilia bacterium]|nr:hypothetical protein [Thermoleophilia bacterium]